MKKTRYKVALGGVIASLALFCMFCTSLAPFLTYAAPMFAGTLMIIMVVEISYSWAFLTYAAISVLSLFITPDKEAAMLFIFLLGYYPIFAAPMKIGIEYLPKSLRLSKTSCILKRFIISQ